MPYADPAKHLANKRRWQKERYANDPEFRERARARSRISHPVSGERVRVANRTHNEHRTRARVHGYEYEPIDKATVFERDGWLCRRCGKPTDRAAYEVSQWDSAHPNPDYPTLGYIVALSLGGAHTYDNVACECWQCNVAAGADSPAPPCEGESAA